MSRPLNLDASDRVGCRVTFSVNRFYLYTAAGVMLGAYLTKQALKDDLALNRISGALFDSAAIRQYRAA